jgi:hypothetical protein
MKTHSFSLPTLAIVLLLASLLPTLAADPKAGDSVAAVWTDGNYYLGTITAISGEKAAILYEDGDKKDVPLSKVHPLSQTADFKSGDHVVAAWKGARMYPGLVTAVGDLTCTVKWDDGDKPMEVKKGRIILAPK